MKFVKRKRGFSLKGFLARVGRIREEIEEIKERIAKELMIPPSSIGIMYIRSESPHGEEYKRIEVGLATGEFTRFTNVELEAIDRALRGTGWGLFEWVFDAGGVRPTLRFYIQKLVPKKYSIPI